MRKTFNYWLPPVAHMALIFYLSSQSSFPVEVPPWMMYADKVVHAGLFGFLALLFARALTEGRYARLTLPIAAAAVAFASLYGITDELHQVFVPNRSPDASDWVADTLGALILCTGLYLWNRKPSVEIGAENG